MNKFKNPNGKPYEFRVRYDVEQFEALPADDGMVTMRGYASVSNIESVRWGLFRVVVRPGAFAKTILEANIRALWNHNDDFALASTKSGTLRLWEDSKGLGFEFEINPVGINETFVDNIKRQIVEGVSIGFDAIKEQWTVTEGEMDLLEIMEVRLYEISPCTFPQFEETSVEAIEFGKHIHARGQAGKSTTPLLEPDQAAVEPGTAHSVGEQRARMAEAAVFTAKYRGLQTC